MGDVPTFNPKEGEGKKMCPYQEEPRQRLTGGHLTGNNSATRVHGPDLKKKIRGRWSDREALFNFGLS